MCDSVIPISCRLSVGPNCACVYGDCSIYIISSTATPSIATVVPVSCMLSDQAVIQLNSQTISTHQCYHILYWHCFKDPFHTTVSQLLLRHQCVSWWGCTTMHQQHASLELSAYFLEQQTGLFCSCLHGQCL